MARSIPLIQIEERAVLPGQLPDARADLPAIAAAQAAQQAGQVITGLTRTLIAPGWKATCSMP